MGLKPILWNRNTVKFYMNLCVNCYPHFKKSTAMLSKVLSYCAMACISMVMASAESKHSANKDPGFPELDAYLKLLIDSGGFPGIAVEITNGSNIVYKKCFGVTNAQTKQKLKPSHIFILRLYQNLLPI